MVDDLDPAVPRALHDRIQLLFGQELGDRDAARRGETGQRHHGVAVPAEHEGLRALDGDAQRLGQEVAHPRRVEHAGHSENALPRQLRDPPGDLAHRVERVGDDDQDRVRRAGQDLANDVSDDALIGRDQIVPAHSGLPRHPRRDDDDFGPGRCLVGVGASHPRVEPLDGSRLEDVEGLSLRDTGDDVDQDDVGDLFLDDPLRHGGADVAGPDHRDFLLHAGGSYPRL